MRRRTHIEKKNRRCWSFKKGDVFVRTRNGTQAHNKRGTHSESSKELPDDANFKFLLKPLYSLKSVLNQSIQSIKRAEQTKERKGNKLQILKAFPLSTDFIVSISIEKNSLWVIKHWRVSDFVIMETKLPMTSHGREKAVRVVARIKPSAAYPSVKSSSSSAVSSVHKPNGDKSEAVSISFGAQFPG